MRVVFDTNIYISAFAIPGGNAEKAYFHAISGDIDLITSIAILTETAGKLEEKFGWEKPQIARLLKAISHVATVIRTTPHLNVVSDDPDNRILECAVQSQARLLVTGDRHLLQLKHYQSTEIVKLAAFLKILEQP
ncbi:MAG: putative toxin-antitoxin system toxin component, PIN family [Deltaproteobacteria bacterium]|nr:putative toxin-antitoxin system toxin component, PIN family [Deltaproteobacteria bacterium]